MPCFLAEVGGEIGDLHFLSRWKSPPVFCYQSRRNCRFFYSRMLSWEFRLKFTFNIVAFEKEKHTSHPLLRSTSAFEACCHDALRHVLYSAAKIVCILQMSHSKAKGSRQAIFKNGRHYITQHKWHILYKSVNIYYFYFLTTLLLYTLLIVLIFRLIWFPCTINYDLCALMIVCISDTF